MAILICVVGRNPARLHVLDGKENLFCETKIAPNTFISCEVNGHPPYTMSFFGCSSEMKVAEVFAYDGAIVIAELPTDEVGVINVCLPKCDQTSLICHRV